MAKNLGRRHIIIQLMIIEFQPWLPEILVQYMRLSQVYGFYNSQHIKSTVKEHQDTNELGRSLGYECDD